MLYLEIKYSLHYGFPGAVRTNRGYKKAEFADIKSEIQNWLRNSGDRHGGRKSRRESKLEKQSELIQKLQQQVID